ncbi:hypothetical protein CK203_052330 [Vitis vinifera]|uniref:Uncharacterized protein n=1 Tax=Vitis vinifera TaxID=29760 RepID=A0A438H2T4_VITVI|nr:hypothetical protein CK203_052330 [Vitis vinifera]
MMRRFNGQNELLRPTKTQFATAFITLSRLHEQRNNLKKTFRICQIVSGPLVRGLRLIDGEKKAPMGYIYEAMNRAKDMIVRSFNGNEEKYKEILNIIDKRWEIQLHPLLATGAEEAKFDTRARASSSIIPPTRGIALNSRTLSSHSLIDEDEDGNMVDSADEEDGEDYKCDDGNDDDDDFVDLEEE